MTLRVNTKLWTVELQADEMDMGMKMLMMAVPGVPGEDYPILQQVKGHKLPNLLMVIPTCKTLRCLTSLSSLASAESLEVRVNHRSARSFLSPCFLGYYADPSEPSGCQVEPWIFCTILLEGEA